MASDRIPQSFIDEVLTRLDIVDVVDSRLKLKRSGKNYVACCPFHKEKTPSFTVSQEKQFYYCFGCGASGTALSFVMEFDRLGFLEALELFARQLGLELPQRETLSTPAPQSPLLGLLEFAQNYFRGQLNQHSPARRYLHGRGIVPAAAQTFGIGYAPAHWSGLVDHCREAGHDPELLVAAGLAGKRESEGKYFDRFRDRITFPIRNQKGKIVGFGGRIIVSDSSAPKYLNSPETDVFHKGRELYGLYEARQATQKLSRLIVVEGYLDVASLAQAGITEVAATLGTACGEEHLHLAFRYTSEVLFCFDGDAAGRRAAERALFSALPALQEGRRVRFLFLPEGQDPDSMVRQVGAQRLRETLSQALPLEEFFFEVAAAGADLRTMEGRAGLSQRAAPQLARLPHSAFKQLMLDELARRTGLSREDLAALSAEPRPAPPSAPVRAPAKAKARPASLTPARLATILLLEQPELIEVIESETLPAANGDADLERLQQLVAFMRVRRQASFHTILGHWGGQFGIAAQADLTALVANQFLRAVHRAGSYNTAQELKDACARLRQAAANRAWVERLNTLKAREGALTEAEKTELKLLLASRPTVATGDLAAP